MSDKQQTEATTMAIELLGAKNPGRWLCEKYRPQIEEGLAYDQIGGVGLLKFEPFLAAVVDDLVRDKATGKGDLWRAFQTAPETAMSALQFAAQMKLLPGSKYGLLYLIPRRNRGRLEVNAQIGYRGLCTVSRRHPRVHSVEAFLVYEGEEFSFDAGAGKLRHIVNLTGDRSEEKIIAGYMRCIVTEEATKHAVLDSPIFWVMTRDEILKRRDCSDAWRNAEKSWDGKPPRKDSPWHLWPHEQYRKTVLIGGINHGSVPQDMGLGGAIERDTQADLVSEPAPLPRMSRQQEIRQDLGLDEKQDPFPSCEHAVEFIRTADKAALEAARGRWDWLQGSDVETVAQAYQDRLQELGE